jgi:hypothetical protein
VAEIGEFSRQVQGNGGLPHATLAVRYRYDWHWLPPLTPEQ